MLWVSALGYIVSHGVSALCVWYGFGSQIVTTEISEAEVGVTRFIPKSGVYLDRWNGNVSIYLYIVICLGRQYEVRCLCRRYDVIWSICRLDEFSFCMVSIWSDVFIRFTDGDMGYGCLYEVVSRVFYSI